MSAFVDLLTQYIDNLQIEGDFATGKIDSDEKYTEFRTALNNYGFCFTIRSSRKEAYSTEDDRDIYTHPPIYKEDRIHIKECKSKSIISVHKTL